MDCVTPSQKTAIRYGTSKTIYNIIEAIFKDMTTGDFYGPEPNYVKEAIEMISLEGLELPNEQSHILPDVHVRQIERQMKVKKLQTVFP